MIYLFFILLGFGGGAIGGYYFIYRQNEHLINQAEHNRVALVESAQRRQTLIKKETDDTVLKLKEDLTREFDNYFQERSKELEESQVNIQIREARQEARLSKIVSQEKKLDEYQEALRQRETAVENLKSEIDKIEKERVEKLYAKSGLDKNEAKKEYLNNKLEQAKHDFSAYYFNYGEEIKEHSELLAKSILDTAYYRCDCVSTSERINYLIEFPSEKLKQRALSNKEEWLKAISELCGAELSLSDDESKVHITSQDFMNREIARRVLTNCFAQSRFGRSDIEQFVGRIHSEIERICNQAANELLKRAKAGDATKEIKKYLGRLRFRTSYTQNQWFHALEVSQICGVVASELGVEQRKARRAGIFHDIGKAFDHTIEGSHALLGMELLKNNHEDVEIIQAVGAHHYEEAPHNALDYIVIAGDSISGARPGARYEKVENYFDRLRVLEQLAREVKGVTKAFALQAGRELRVYVDNRRVSDEDCQNVAEAIAKKIEQNLVYPGLIQVTVIRETIISNYAA